MTEPGSIKTAWKRKHPLFEWAWFSIGTRVAAWLLLLAGLVGGWYYGVPLLQSRTLAQQADQRVTVQFINPPAWFHGDIATSLALTIQDIASGNPFDQEQLALINEALANSGWFERINQVRRVPPNIIEIDAEFVRPFAMIRGDDADHLVDPRGRRLPIQLDPEKPQSQFIVITGAIITTPPRLGEHWPGSEVIASLQLVRLIDAAPWRHQVKAVDASAYANDHTVSIITDVGNTINFEHAPGEEEPLELSAEQKLQLLAHNFRTHGHIAGSYPTDLRFSGGALYSKR